MQRGVISLVAWMVAVVMVVATSGCATTTDTAAINGVVFGQSVPTDTGSLLTPSTSSAKTAPLPAAITCNGITTHANAQGTFSVHVRPAGAYTCSVSVPLYLSQKVTVPGSIGNAFVLAFDLAENATCGRDRASPLFECPSLRLTPGSVTGSVRSSSSQQGIAGAQVKCVPAGSKPDATDTLTPLPTDTSGAFSLHDVPPGAYGCVAMDAHNGAAFAHLYIRPAQEATLTFSLCDAQCPPVTLHGGPVMHTYTAYLIYWTPPGSPLDPGGGDDRFKATIEQYVRDVGGTPFFALLTQYFDYRGHVQNATQLGGTYDDVRPYQHCNDSLNTCVPTPATQADPLLDGDIRAEVRHALAVNPSWQVSLDSEFIVLTGYGAEECTTPDHTWCSYHHGTYGFCGWHDGYSIDSVRDAVAPIIYAYIPSQANDDSRCAGTGYVTPHGDPVLDSAIDVLSHEQFESVTDPLPGRDPAWYTDVAPSSDSPLTEIGDLCETRFGSIGPDGGNITLHDHRYRLQPEWSNSAANCVFT
jgi:hypothetical protein